MRFARICWDLMGIAEICWDLLGFAGIYWDLLGFVRICWDLLKDALSVSLAESGLRAPRAVLRVKIV